MSDDNPDRERDADPFERLGDANDREGDPFDRLDDGAATDDGPGERRPGSPETGDGGIGSPDAPGHESERSGDAASGVGTPGSDPTAGGPDVDLPADGAGSDSADPFPGVDDRAGDPFEAAESAFERMDVGDIDPDSVWETLGDAQVRGSVSERQGRTYAEVSKHRFCERCEYFSDPPEIDCSHEGTEIVEFLSMETVRVVDCPVVAERRELERQE